MRTISKFSQFLESNEKLDKSKKSDVQDQLSDDIENVEMEIDDDKIDMDDYYIEDILDVIVPDVSNNENLSSITVHSDLTKKETKRGDIIWVTALLRKKGASFTSPAVSGVIKCRIVDLFYGLTMLNKVMRDK